MAYNESVMDRLREAFLDVGTEFSEKKMFGGVCVMVDDKMCICTKTEKDSGHDRLLCRISDQDYERELENPEVTPMGHGKSVMRNFVYVDETGFKTKNQLERWVKMCLEYNPLAKKSKT
ncbi:TfoX/Sxy family protein [Flavobacterium sp. MAH-1]|uniref:TfoX/Sxy family protein n=1 Tax=Flavobacterium agri TaxID=2743471 RepID=A0A7Y9C7F7_9FLAO|nr:TfoX/Sxy family protein [Flavobacterium agri]NUY81288.1 TfoX/Sxy family protein [Flavobacterium agri]NYA71312.1 TfoX/Sxy family protein [Flavobacterium agri]